MNKQWLALALIGSVMSAHAYAEGPAKTATPTAKASAPAQAAKESGTKAEATQASEWTIDSGHSRFGFSVPHMVVSEVDGRFHKATGKVLLDEKDLTKSVVEIEIDVASVDTENADRDKHLTSPDFFDAAKYPKITFKATKIKKAGKGYKVSGDLTMRGVTKPVTLDVEISQAIKNPWGKEVRGVKAKGKLNRQDFGVSWNKSLDAGGLLVGDEVALNLQLELNK